MLLYAFCRKQTWGVLISFEIRRSRQNTLGNFIDSKSGTFTQQTGILEGIAKYRAPPYSPISDALFFLFYVNANARQKTVGT
jgi:hypothetical protein